MRRNLALVGPGAKSVMSTSKGCEFLPSPLGTFAYGPISAVHKYVLRKLYIAMGRLTFLTFDDKETVS